MNKKMENKKYGIITPMDYSSSLGTRVTYWMMFGFLMLMVVVCLAPVLFAFFSGFKTTEEFYSLNVKLFPDNIDFSKMFEIIKELKLGRAFVVSMILFAITWFGDVVIGGIAGYTISRLKPKGSAMLFKLMLWTMMMPGTLSMVPLFMFWADVPVIHISFLNTFVPFIIGSFGNIFHILMFKNFFDGIPNSFIEAAKIDGASNLGIFFKVIVPLSKPIIMTITIFAFTGSWNNFMSPFLYLKDPQLAPVALKLYNTTVGYPEPTILLAAFLITIPVLIVYFVCSNQILANDMSAGVKE